MHVNMFSLTSKYLEKYEECGLGISFNNYGLAIKIGKETRYINILEKTIACMLYICAFGIIVYLLQANYTISDDDALTVFFIINNYIQFFNKCVIIFFIFKRICIFLHFSSWICIVHIS